MIVQLFSASPAAPLGVVTIVGISLVAMDSQGVSVAGLDDVTAVAGIAADDGMAIDGWVAPDGHAHGACSQGDDSESDMEAIGGSDVGHSTGPDVLRPTPITYRTLAPQNPDRYVLENARRLRSMAYERRLDPTKKVEAGNQTVQCFKVMLIE